MTELSFSLVSARLFVNRHLPVWLVLGIWLGGVAAGGTPGYRIVVSIVYTPQMITLTNLPACDMPHGVKVNHAGTKVYVTCMNSDEVLEIDRPSLAITRRHRTGEGMLPQAMPMKMGHGGPQAAGAAVHDACMPTFVSVSPDDARLYVACHPRAEPLALDARPLER